MRLIDADAFAEYLKQAIENKKYRKLFADNILSVGDVLHAVVSELEGTGLQGYKNAPTVERPRGEWIDRSDGGRIRYPFWERYECSKCGAKSENTNFCPNCGADMRVSKELNSEIEKSNSEKTCLNCGTSEQECELGNRARHGFCGNWTERR